MAQSQPKIVSSPQKSANGRVPVILSKRYGKHFPGDVAGFSEEISGHLVKSGAAQYVEAEKAAEPAKAVEPAKK